MKRIHALFLSACFAAGLHAEIPPFVPGSNTLAVLPDTQYYAQKYPKNFEAQTAWLAEHAEARNLTYVLHVGDIVQDDLPDEWKVAKRCFSMLDGKAPYLLIPGNHDYSGGTRASRLSEAFPVKQFETWSTFGEVFEPGKLDNNVHLFEIEGRKWMALGLEYGPRKAVMEWAGQMLEKYKDRRAIIVTDGYMFYNNQRYDHRMGSQRASPYGYAGDGADGEILWNQVIRRHPNVMIVACGHVATGGLGYRANEGDYGNVVHQMMVNYQKMRGGGMAYLRLLEFLPGGNSVQVRTYSPLTDKQRISDLEDFRFTLKDATRDHPVRVPAVKAVPLFAPPIFEREFDPLVLTADTSHALPDGLINDLDEVSVEIWLKPTAETYDWHAPFYFGAGGEKDAIYYTFRSTTQHRAEIIRAGHNERIQRTVHMPRDQATHVMMTYDWRPEKQKGVINYYRDGEWFGAIETDMVLRNLDLHTGRLGPFAGEIFRFRVFDRALSNGEVAGSFMAGADALRPEDP